MDSLSEETDLKDNISTFWNLDLAYSNVPSVWIVYGEQDVRGRRLVGRCGCLGIRGLVAIILLETGERSSILFGNK